MQTNRREGCAVFASGGVQCPVMARSSPQRTAPPEAKTCAACGRTIEWRKKWERDWANVRFCSDSCRRKKPSSTDQALEETILRLLAERGRDKTICPSEAARAVAAAAQPEGSADDPARWQPLMEPARAAARRLVSGGRILITQGGHAVDPSTARGPIRLKLL